VVLASLVAFVCVLPLAVACGPDFPQVTFISEPPDPPLEGYASGNLGVVVPSYDPSYLAVAYRYFVGQPFDAAERGRLVDMWNARLYAYVGGPSAASSVVFATPSNSFESYPNCLADAARTADETRNDRIRQFGANSAAVASWSAAQARVFDNCEPGSVGDPSLPEPADPNLPPIIRKDRDYQIAAAYFYAGNFDEAKKRFLAIAGDADSPWRVTAALVAARCDIRAATLVTDDPVERKQKLVSADDQLKTVIANPAFSPMKASAERLIAFVGYRLDPDAEANELADSIARRTAPENIGVNLADYDQLMRRGHPGPRSSSANQLNDMTDWIHSFQFGGRADTQDHRVTRWEQTQSLVWLAAALAYAQPEDAKAAELLDAAAKVPVASPAYLTIAFHQNRLLAFGGKQAQAQASLYQILSMPKDRLSISTRNLFLALRMQSARNLEEFLQFAPRQPLGIVQSLDISDPELCDRAPRACMQANGALFDSDAAIEFTQAMPTSVLVQAAASARLPQDLRLEVAQAAWVRAILLDQDALARQLVPTLSALEPDIAPQLKAYNDQTSFAERKFAAIFLILHRPGMAPYVYAGLGRSSWNGPTPQGEINSYRQNWWCTFVPPPPPSAQPNLRAINMGVIRERMNLNFRGGLSALYPGGKPISPPFTTPGEQQTAAGEWTSLTQVDAAPDWLGRQVLDWVKAHADDPRVPEALHYVVISTRYGCNDSDTGDYSKQAFTLLHSRYQQSSWAAQTSYSFN